MKRLQFWFCFGFVPPGWKPRLTGSQDGCRHMKNFPRPDPAPSARRSQPCKNRIQSGCESRTGSCEGGSGACELSSGHEPQHPRWMRADAGLWPPSPEVLAASLKVPASLGRERVPLGQDAGEPEPGPCQSRSRCVRGGLKVLVTLASRRVWRSRFCSYLRANGLTLLISRLF